MSAPTSTPRFRSKAQRRKWREFVAEGRVTQAQFDARDQGLGERGLPERTTPRPRTVGASRSADAAKLGHNRY
jgi:hypothetical protein